MIITAGKFKGRKIITPDESITRPTLSKIRQGVFNSLYSIIGDFDNETFIDMFAGSGIMGLEALSRGFLNVISFEQNKKVAKIIKKNYDLLSLNPNLKIGDSLKLINNIIYNSGVIYIDPPYNSGIYEKIFDILYNINFKGIIITEYTKKLFINNFMLIREKRYGDKIISFWQIKV